MYKGPKGVWFKHSCEKPQRLNHFIFRNAAPNIQDRTRKDKTNGFKIHHTPSKLRPQAKPFEGLHSVGPLRNGDKIACHDKLVLSDHLDVLKF